jgi:hypothetical protein
MEKGRLGTGARATRLPGGWAMGRVENRYRERPLNGNQRDQIVPLARCPSAPATGSAAVL